MPTQDASIVKQMLLVFTKRKSIKRSMEKMDWIVMLGHKGSITCVLSSEILLNAA